MTTLGSQACYPSPFWRFLAEKGPKNPKRTGMTTLGSPDLSSQSVSVFSGRKGPKNLGTDLDDNPGKPRLVIPVCFGVFWPQMDWGDNPGLPKLVIPIRFRCFLAFFGQKLRSKIAQSGPTGIATVTATLAPLPLLPLLLWLALVLPLLLLLLFSPCSTDYHICTHECCCYYKQSTAP